MKPSSLKMRARLIFNREAGISTLSNPAWPALRIRVNMSARGSVMLILHPPLELPTGFGHPGDLSPEGQVAETDAADAEPAEKSPGAAAQRTAMIFPDLEPRF